jgi:predicted  nucleic acid-binding Zn-ribbon protein
MSDTPRTDQIEKLAYWFQDDMTPVCESRFVRSLERELNAANAEIERLTNKVAQLYEGAEEAKQRIKRLEEAGDALCENSSPSRWDSPADTARKLTDQSNWNKAKEAK